MGNYTIGQVADTAKVNASTIRYYESVKLLPVPKRVNGQRRYSDEVFNRINFIKIAQQAGFTVQEILSLLEGFENNTPPSERWNTMAVRKYIELKEKKEQIDTMIKILEKGLKCQCPTWTECFMNLKPDGTCE